MSASTSIEHQKHAQQTFHGGISLAFMPDGRTPPDKEFPLGEMALVWQKTRGGLRLVDISRTPFGFFLEQVHPIS